MIQIFFTSNDHHWSDDRTGRVLSLLPDDMQKNILAYKGWQDRQSRILGKWLLMRMLERFEIEAGLDELRYTEFNKPYFPNLYSAPLLKNGAGVRDMLFDFSIAHSGSMVICAGVNGALVGVDIERTVPISVEDQRDQLSIAEWDYIKRAPDQLIAFYEIWTRKESLLKACGSGVDIDMDSLDVLSDTVMTDGVNYTFYPLYIAEGYIAHIATSAPSGNVSIFSERRSGPL